MRSAITLAVSVTLAAGVAGCRIHTEKGANGEDKNVRIDTPFGGVHVNTDQTNAADLGLPVYPGAVAIKDDDKHKSADVHVGFGEWQLRVRAVSYGSPDPKEKVTVFYKKALGRYGDVITCQGNAPIGTPTATSEGLTCNDEKGGKVNINENGTSYGYSSEKNGLQLKAGSKRHQHIVGFDEPKDGQTRFVLVALDLPAGSVNDSDKSE
jgi:hypothetical protein